MSGNSPVSMGVVTIARTTPKAVLAEWAGGKKEWIPQSAVHDDSEVWRQGDKGKLVVLSWFARKKGWDY